jgi:hypothetical protein
VDLPERAAMDSAREHDFAFNEAVSFIVKGDPSLARVRHGHLVTAVYRTGRRQRTNEAESDRKRKQRTR